MRKSWNERYLDIVEGKPVVMAIAGSLFAVVVLVIEGIRRGEDPLRIALTAGVVGALFAILGAFYPSIHKFTREQRPTRKM